MPIIQSAIKRSRQAIKRRDRNVGIKRDIKSALKAFLAEPSAATLSAAHSELDTAVKKHLLKKNTVARRKASLAKIAKDAGVKLGGAKTSAKPATKPAAKTPAKAAAKTTAVKPAAKKPAATKAATAKVPAKTPAAKKPTK